MIKKQIVQRLAIRNYKLKFPLKNNEFIQLEECFKNMKKNSVPCKLDLETYKAVHVKFQEIAFNFFSSGKGTLYFSSEVISVKEADDILNNFHFVFVRPFVFKVKS